MISPRAAPLRFDLHVHLSASRRKLSSDHAAKSW
jgi:hypothetical protein